MVTPVFILICICLVLKAQNGYFDYELVMSTSFILEKSLKVLDFLNFNEIIHNFLMTTNKVLNQFYKRQILNFNKENLCFSNIQIKFYFPNFLIYLSINHKLFIFLPVNHLFFKLSLNFNCIFLIKSNNNYLYLYKSSASFYFAHYFYLLFIHLGCP